MEADLDKISQEHTVSTYKTPSIKDGEIIAQAKKIMDAGQYLKPQMEKELLRIKKAKTVEKIDMLLINATNGDNESNMAFLLNELKLNFNAEFKSNSQETMSVTEYAERIKSYNVHKHLLLYGKYQDVSCKCFNLEKEFKSTKKQLAKAQKEKLDFRFKFKELRKKNSGLGSENKQLKETTKALELKLREQNKTLKKQAELITKHEEMIEKFSLDADAKNKECEEKNATIRNLEGAFDSQKNIAFGHLHKNILLEGDAAGFSKKVESQLGIINCLREKHQQFLQEKSEQTNLIEKLKGKVSQQQTTIERLEHENQDWQASFSLNKKLNHKPNFFGDDGAMEFLEKNTQTEHKQSEINAETETNSEFTWLST